jgi:iron(III) transport system permease protein
LHRTRFSLSTLPLILLVGLLALPVLALLASWLPWGVVQADTGAILREMAAPCCLATSGPRCGWA